MFTFIPGFETRGFPVHFDNFVAQYSYSAGRGRQHVAHDNWLCAAIRWMAMDAVSFVDFNPPLYWGAVTMGIRVQKPSCFNPRARAQCRGLPREALFPTRTLYRRQNECQRLHNKKNGPSPYRETV